MTKRKFIILKHDSLKKIRQKLVCKVPADTLVSPAHFLAITDTWSWTVPPWNIMEAYINVI